MCKYSVSTERPQKMEVQSCLGMIREDFTRKALEMDLEECIEACKVGAGGEARRDCGAEKRALDLESEAEVPVPAVPRPPL